MKRLLVALLGLLVFAPAVAADPTGVSIQFQSFGPSPVDVLPGESVQWSNVSERTHTVTADDGSFDSGDVDPGVTYSVTFANPGAYPYHCTKHAGMVGEVDVRAVTLGVLPTAAVPAGDKVDFDGRTSNPGETVRIERSTGGAFQTVGSAQPAADGTWKTSIVAQATGDYRAVIAAGESEVRHLVVSDRKVAVRATRRGITVTVTPALPYARIALQQDLRERFGWWTTKLTRLDYLSSASFNVKRPARVRAVLVDKDGWTALATSPVLTLGHAKRSKPAPAMPMNH